MTVTKLPFLTTLPPQLTPMMEQFAQAKDEHPDAVVLFRLGDFYEMFAEDAVQGSRLLELVLTSREVGKGNRVAMCGVPVHAVDSYIARLINAGCKVAICEQMEDAKLTRGLVRREVIRVITPGTVVEEGMLEEADNNFLVALCETEAAYGLAALDVSTGEFIATTLDGDGARDALQAELARLRPAECLVSPQWQGHEGGQAVVDALHLCCTVCDDAAFDLAAAQLQLGQQFGAGEDGAAACVSLSPLALRASGAILHYVQAMHKAVLPHLTALRPYQLSQYMVLDAITRRNLELVRTMRQGERQGSLLHSLDETVTSMGARLLQRWLEQPLLQTDAIDARLDAVAELVAEPERRQHLRQALQGIYDIERLVGRVACGTANARALLALQQALEALSHVRQALSGCHAALLETLLTDCVGEDDLVAMLQETIADDPPATLRDGGLIRAGYDTALDQLINETDRHKQWVARLQARERKRTGIKSLKVGFNQVFGYYIEVSKANVRLVPDNYHRKQTLSHGERYITESLKEREVAILHASEQRVELEYSLFVDIRQQIANQSALLQRLAACIAQLDTLAALAEVAALYDYVRPTVSASDDHIVVRQGRHPVVERSLDGFVPNDLVLDREAQQLVMLTGPNMAGKSTYLRQLALITLLAQMGSFVPAESAQIALVDRIFTRVGAVDDIAAGRSTFLVEMSETAHILHNATPRSLLILDEIGKGTSTFEGLSIAWAVALYIVRRLGSRGLFATHYHELTALEVLSPGICNFHMAIRETPEGIVFLRQVAPGGASKSYGLHVARLAGLPSEVIDEGARVLNYLEAQGREPVKRASTPINGTVNSSAPPAVPEGEIEEVAAAAAVVVKRSPLGEQLLALDLCQVTPLQALTVLHDLQQQARAAGQRGGALS